jgi:ABC-type cobalamin transport system permease subunit
MATNPNIDAEIVQSFTRQLSDEVSDLFGRYADLARKAGLDEHRVSAVMVRATGGMVGVVVAVMMESGLIPNASDRPGIMRGAVMLTRLMLYMATRGREAADAETARLCKIFDPL